MKIYVAINDFAPGAVQLLKEHNHEVIVRSPEMQRPNEEELCEIVTKYDGIIIGIKEIITEKVYKSAKGKLKFIGTLSIGTDHISEKVFQDKEIKILNCPISNVPSVTEYTFAMLLELVKKTNQQHGFTKGEITEKPKSIDLHNKYFGVIGAGKIAENVIKVASAFGMSILAWTFHPENHLDLTKKYDVQFLSIDELFEASDFIGLFLPLTQESKGIASKDLLSKMKNTSYFVSISRLETIDLQALIDLLSNKKIAGVGIDADFPEAFLDKIKPLDNFIASSHVAGSNIDADMRIDFDMAESIITNLERSK